MRFEYVDTHVGNKLYHHKLSSLKLEEEVGGHDFKIHPLTTSVSGSKVCCAVYTSEVFGKPGIVSCSDSALPWVFFLRVCVGKVSTLGTRKHHPKSIVMIPK